MAVSSRTAEIKANGRRRVEQYPGNPAWQFTSLTSNLILTAATRHLEPATKIRTEILPIKGHREKQVSLPWEQSRLNIVTDISDIKRPKFESVSLQDVFTGLPLLADEIHNRFNGQSYFLQRNRAASGIIDHAFYRLNFIPDDLLKRVGSRINKLAQIADPRRVGEIRDNYPPERMTQLIKYAMGGLAWGVKKGNGKVLDILGVAPAISGWYYQQDVQFEITRLFNEIMQEHKARFLQGIGPKT